MPFYDRQHKKFIAAPKEAYKPIADISNKEFGGNASRVSKILPEAGFMYVGQAMLLSQDALTALPKLGTKSAALFQQYSKRDSVNLDGYDAFIADEAFLFQKVLSVDFGDQEIGRSLDRAGLKTMRDVMVSTDKKLATILGDNFSVVQAVIDQKLFIVERPEPAEITQQKNLVRETLSFAFNEPSNHWDNILNDVLAVASLMKLIEDFHHQVIADSRYADMLQLEVEKIERLDEKGFFADPEFDYLGALDNVARAPKLKPLPLKEIFSVLNIRHNDDWFDNENYNAQLDVLFRSNIVRETTQKLERKRHNFREALQPSLQRMMR
ncbi:MAG: hypothetical protein CMH30_00925 [Micavibrio sp.]|nr:hypothetical protein [Micavibrio sp.]